MVPDGEALRQSDRVLAALTTEGILRSEWSKLWSLRSPYWIVAAIILTPIVLGMARSVVAPPLWEADPLDGTAAVFESVAIGALPVAFLSAILGLVAMGSEYADDALSNTLIVSPRRKTVLLAKSASALVGACVASLLGFSAAGALGVFILANRGYADLPLGTIAALVLCGVGGSSLLSVLGIACAALSRSVVAGAIHLACILAVLPTILGLGGGPATRLLIDFLPATAVQALVTRPPATPFTIEGAPPSTMAWWGGLAILVAWVALYLSAASARISKRDVSKPETFNRRRGARTFRAPTSARRGLGLGNIVRSEGVKLVTLTSTWWLLGLSSIAIVWLAAFRASSVRPEDVTENPLSPGDLALVSVDQQSQVISGGVGVAQILLAFLGALAFTTEYASGSIRATLIAAPRRSSVFIAKLTVVGAASLGTAGLSFLSASLIATPLQSQQGFDVSLDQPGVIETVIRSTLVCLLVATIGCAVGALLRDSIASIATLVAVLILSHSALSPLQVLTRGTPLVYFANLDEFFPLPILAAQPIPPNTYFPEVLEGNVIQVNPDQALLVVAGWAVLSIGSAMAVFHRRGV